MGIVKNIWVVGSESDTTGKPLKTRAKERIDARAAPVSDTFDKYVEMRRSCWLLEEVHHNDIVDFFCDCPVGMKVSGQFYLNVFNFILFF